MFDAESLLQRPGRTLLGGVPEGYDALVAEKPELKTLTPLFLVPARSKANREMRASALMAQAREFAAQAQGRAAEELPEALRTALARGRAIEEPED